MEESLTKEKFAQNSWENGDLSKVIENPSKRSKNTGLSCETIFFGGREGDGSWNKWRGGHVGPTSLVGAARGWPHLPGLWTTSSPPPVDLCAGIFH